MEITLTMKNHKDFNKVFNRLSRGGAKILDYNKHYDIIWCDVKEDVFDIVVEDLGKYATVEKLECTS